MIFDLKTKQSAEQIFDGCLYKPPHHIMHRRTSMQKSFAQVYGFIFRANVFGEVIWNKISLKGRRAGGSCLKFGNCEFVKFVGLAVAILSFFKSLYKLKIVVMNDWD